MKTRVGLGFDVHRLEEGKDLWLGGIRIPASKGAVGHSDADVLIHAVCDALLGAAGLGDIGQHFSNSDPRWKGMDSKYFLKEVMNMVKAKGWSVENIDCIVCLEAPKINPHIPAMKKALSPIVGIEEESISIKATTSEQLGYVGRGEGVNAMAVALVFRE